MKTFKKKYLVKMLIYWNNIMAENDDNWLHALYKVSHYETALNNKEK